MDSTQDSSQTVRQNHSCARCAERKVKCDRELPCGACVRHDLACVFNPLPPRNRHRRLNNNGNAQTQILTDRLRKYKAWFREQGIDPEYLPVEAPFPLQTQSAPPVRPELPRLAHSTQSTQSTPSGASPGQPKFANNVLWTRVIEEFEVQDDPDTTLDGSHDSDEVEGGQGDSADTLGNTNIGPSFIFDSHLPSPGPHSRRPAHPPPDTIRRLWQAYCENVDPLTKLLHVPTVQHALDKALHDSPSTVPRAFEALMFAVYAAAVMSLREDDCSQRLGEPRPVLLLRYLAATEAALTRADVLGTTDIVVLQALLLYLLAVRDLYEPRAVWTLTGVAMRLAEGMGLDHDGAAETSSPSSLSPFDVEMRRRLWWQLRMHDFRTAELCGRPKFQDLDMDRSPASGSMATQWPANVDDATLNPMIAGSPLPPLGEASSATDAVFVAVKCELLRFTAARLSTMRRQQSQSTMASASNPWSLYTMGALDNDFRDIEARLETRYLRYCDPSQPLHLMATLMARCAINILRFMARHPRRWTDNAVGGGMQNSEERVEVWRICLTILDQQHMLQANPHLRSFAWHAPFFQQWHAIIHVLDTLRADPVIEQAARAWSLIEKTYVNNPEMLSGRSKKPIHVAVGNLCLKAYAQYEAVDGSGETTPSFILQLRKTREKAARVAKDRNSKAQQTGQVDKSTVVNDSAATAQTNAPGFDSSTETEGNSATPGDAETTNFDLLADMDNDPAAGVDWNRWDAWLVGADA